MIVKLYSTELYYFYTTFIVNNTLIPTKLHFSNKVLENPSHCYFKWNLYFILTSDTILLKMIYSI